MKKHAFFRQGWYQGLSWSAALIVFSVAVYLLLEPNFGDPFTLTPAEKIPSTANFPPNAEVDFSIPEFNHSVTRQDIVRRVRLNTILPTRSRQDAVEYTVQFNDSVFGIADKFNIKPETVLWSNYDELQDNPHSLAPGMELVIPPVDGIYYRWEEGDTIRQIADEFRTEPEKIINWMGNDLDLADPQIEAGAMVMIPDGKRDFQQWIIPTIARGSAGVSAGVYGEGVCIGPFEGVFGSGGFIWPTTNHVLTGNDYWSGHLAIDIGVGIGMPVYAADHGVVVFSGWSAGGYGNVVILDHGNGYQTLYAHLNQTSVQCGQSVFQGERIGSGGSTGNSTGPHLHFEVRNQGGFVNPWFVLPAP